MLNIRNGLGLASVDGIIQTGVIGLLLIGSVLIQNVRVRIRRRDTNPRSIRRVITQRVDQLPRDQQRLQASTNHRKGEEPT